MRVQKCKKKVEKIGWKKVEKMLKIAYFQQFFDDFQHFFKKNFNIFFSTFFLHFYGRQELSKILSFGWKVTFHNGLATRGKNVTWKKTYGPWNSVIFWIFWILKIPVLAINNSDDIFLTIMIIIMMKVKMKITKTTTA